jgi:hypothetical protein
MEIITIACLLVNIFLFVPAVFIGLDIKKPSDWLFGLGSFICGFLIGVINIDLSGGFQIGVIFALMEMIGGAVMREHNKRITM